MLSRDTLKELLHDEDLTRETRLLLCLAIEDGTPQTVASIKETACAAGLTAVKSWNVSWILKSSKGKAIKTPDGWELRQSGRCVVRELIEQIDDEIPHPVLSKLRLLLPKMKDQAARPFVEEAIGCYEAGYYRAAVVFMWVGAVATLQAHVVNHHLPAFNAEATRRNQKKWKEAKNADDLSRMNERDFLDTLDAISVIGKSVKKELVVCLDLRNGGGHPNSLQIEEHRAASHLEILLLHVFAKF